MPEAPENPQKSFVQIMVHQHRPATHCLQNNDTILHGICSPTLCNLLCKHSQATVNTIPRAQNHIQSSDKNLKH